MALTRIWARDMCTASHRVKLLTAALAALYAGILVKGVKAFIEEMFTITPLRRSTIPRVNTCDGSNVPSTFRLNTNSMPFGSRS